MYGSGKETFALISCGIFAIICGFILIFTGVFVARPGIWAEDFMMTTCTVVGHEELDRRQCDCSTDEDEICYSSYPCVQVFVRYEIFQMFNDSTSITSRVHRDESVGVTGSDCSMVPLCSRFPSENTRRVENFVQQYGVLGSNQTCYYNPLNPTEVILSRQFSRADVLAALLVPGVCLGIALLSLPIILFLRKL